MGVVLKIELDLNSGLSIKVLSFGVWMVAPLPDGLYHFDIGFSLS